MKIVLKYQFLIPILAIKCQFLKATKKRNLIWMFEASVSIDRKKPFQFLPKSVKNLFHWLIFFNIFQYQVLAFINVSITRKRLQGSGKFTIWKVLIVKWWSFQFSTKFEKSISGLHLKEISPSICSKVLVVQNKY